MFVTFRTLFVALFTWPLVMLNIMMARLCRGGPVRVG